MRKSTTHVALDIKSNRFTVHSRIGRLAIHDTKRETEHVLYQNVGKYSNRHGWPWTIQDAHELADWLNERFAGYPTGPKFGQLCKLKGLHDGRL